MKVEIIKCLKDNFSYLLINEKNKNACVIDPSESETIIDIIEKRMKNTKIICSESLDSTLNDFPNNNITKSLDELTNEVNQIIENLEKEKNLDNSIEDYQKLIKLNNIIEKKFQAESKNISTETKSKINKIIKKHD